jgi:hypothetical protein
MATTETKNFQKVTGRRRVKNKTSRKENVTIHSLMFRDGLRTDKDGNEMRSIEFVNFKKARELFDGQDEVLVPSIRAHVKQDGNFGKVFATIRSYVDNGGDKLEDANLVYQRTFRNLTHAIKELERVFTLGLNNYDVSGLGGDDVQDVDLREYDDLAKTVSLRISLPIVKESDSEGRTSYTTLRKNYGDDHKTETIYLSDSFMVRVNATPLKQEGTVKLVADFTVGSKTVRKEMNIQESRLIGTLYGIINDEFSGIFNVTITSYGE